MITGPLLLGTITPYALVLAVCAGLGLYLSYLLNKEVLTHLIDGGIVILLVSVLGSRISFVLLNFAHFQDHPLEIPQLWLGGMYWPGALLGAVLSIFLVHWFWKEPLGELADSYLPLLGVVAVGVWLAAWGTGVGYGPQTDAWFGIPVKDLFGTLEKRWPLPILGAVLSAAWIAGAILFPLKRQRPEGSRGVLGAAGLMAVTAVISFLRVDPAPLLLGLRLESWLSLLLMVGFCAGFYLLIKGQSDHEEAGTSIDSSN